MNPPAQRPLAARVLVLGLLVAAGGLCMATSETTPKRYCIRRSATVPVPAPSLRPATRSAGNIEAGVSNDTVLWAKQPKRLQGSNVGLYVPRDQLAWFLTSSWHPMVSLGVSGEAGVGRGPIAISDGLIAPPRESPVGGGAHLGLHFKVSRRLVVDFSCDLWAYRIPSRIASYQSDTCEGLPDPRTWNRQTKTTTTFVGRAQLALGIALGWSHLTLGTGLRNHPHNVDETSELHTSPGEILPELEHAVYPFVFALWEIHATGWLHVALSVYQPLNFDPVIYAPILGISLRLHHRAQRHQRIDTPKE